MEKTEYIEFDIKDENKFKDLLRIFNLICESRKLNSDKSDDFWLKSFPDYSLKMYYFSKKDIRPNFETEGNDDSWHFYSMIEHLTRDLDVEFISCKKVEDNKGRLDFYANGYPYGGISGLTYFLNTFACKATKIDEGGGIYKVKWDNDIELELIDIKDDKNNNQNSLIKSLLSKIKLN